MGNSNDQKSTKSIENGKMYKYNFPIVGVGASAGGLHAFESFFSYSSVSDTPQMSFVLIQHLSPDHQSRLAEIIQKHTEMEVLEIKNGMKVEIGKIYVIPPRFHVSIKAGKLLLDKVNNKVQIRLPINHFFNSLAMELKEKAIGIVLSGSGRDGTIGIESIKREAGLVLAQKREDAQFDSMPACAIKTGLVDFELPTYEMISKIESYLKFNKRIKENETEVSDLDSRKRILNSILESIYKTTAFDFSEYKKGTINRRIQKRMFFKKIDDFEDYASYIKIHPEESIYLVKELLVGVTEFFRDSNVFETLGNVVVEQYFEDTKSSDKIRIWSVGCSTGEEAYSLAILMSEYLERTNKQCKVIIFATDIDEQSISNARLGVFSSNIDAIISEKRLKKYFYLESDGKSYKIKKNIRDMIFFSVHDVLKNPPFSKLDIISCRNLLIYFEDSLQNKLLSTFHYSLKENGLLFLGNAESLGLLKDAFQVVDSSSKIFKKINYLGEDGRILKRNYGTVAKLPNILGETKTISRRPKKLSMKEAAENVVLENTEISGIIIDKLGTILYLHGLTGDYIDPNQGSQKNGNIFNMTRDGLKSDLIGLFGIVIKTNMRQKEKGIEIIVNKNPIYVDLTIVPLRKGSLPNYNIDLYLLLIQETSSSYFDDDFKPNLLKNGKKSGNKYDEISELKHLLKIKEEFLQITTDQLNSTNEDLESLNEEMQSVNEELQSTNEELETTTEELQSINEELNIMNAELNNRVSQLSKLNDDIENFVEGANIPTLFLDSDMNIMRISANISKIMNIKESDVGRPLSHFSSNIIDYNDILVDCKTSYTTSHTIEKEISIGNNIWYVMKIQPYRSIEKDIVGLVITFMDVTKRIELEAEILKETQFNNATMEAISCGVISTDISGNIFFVNRVACSLLGECHKKFIGKKIETVFNIIETPENFNDIYIKDILSNKIKLPNKRFEAKLVAKNGKETHITYKIDTIEIEENKIFGLVVVFSDDTNKVQKNQELKELVLELQRTKALLESSLESPQDINIISLDLEYKYLYFNKAHYKGMKQSYNAEVEVGDCIFDHMTSSVDISKIKKNYDKSFLGVSHTTLEVYGDIQKNYFETYFNPIFDLSGNVIGITIFAMNVTDRESMQNRIILNEKRYKGLVDNLNAGVVVYAEDTTIISCNLVAERVLDLPRGTLIGSKANAAGLIFLDENEKNIDLSEFPVNLIKKSKKPLHNYIMGLCKKDSDEIRWVSVNGIPIFNEEDKIVEIVVSFIDISESRSNERKLEFAAYNDYLTGLYNRRYFEEKIHELDTEESYPLTIIMSDINGLKLINDAFGHSAGDELLFSAAELITKHCRETDLIARIGGDEFIIAMPNTDEETAEKIVGKINKEAEKILTNAIPLSISFGYMTKNSKSEDIQETYRSAEDFMYRKKLLEIPSMRSRAIETILTTLYEKDEKSEVHSRRVSKLSENLAKAYGMTKQDVNEVKTAGLVHDIGKIVISSSLINKVGKLTEDEYRTIQNHSEIGFRILNSTQDMRGISDIVLNHHERWDGKGYPRGIKSNEIPLKSRIISIADSFDAMTSERSYRDTISKEDALIEIIANAGTQFDPELVKVFQKHFTDITNE